MAHVGCGEGRPESDSGYIIKVKLVEFTDVGCGVWVKEKNQSQHQDFCSKKQERCHLLKRGEKRGVIGLNAKHVK